MARSDDRKIRCAFCGRTQDQVDKLIAGNGAYICSDCVRLCMNIVDEDLPQRTDTGREAPSAPAIAELPKPAEIKKNSRRVHRRAGDGEDRAFRRRL